MTRMFDNHAARLRRTDTFADPLEGAEWQGLGWLLPLMQAMAGAGTRPAPAEKSSAAPAWPSCAALSQTRSPATIR